jgi:hypothetical protein
MTPADAPDALDEWIRLDRVTRKVIGWRMTPESDEALDSLMRLREWTARRLAN